MGQSDDILSKRALLGAGVDRVRRAGAYVAGMAVDSLFDRFTPRVQRPPGAIPEVEFLLACTRCGDCVRACPVDAIRLLGDRAGLAAGTPFLDVNEYKPCVACADTPCMTACAPGALRVIPIEQTVMGTAVLDRDTCLAWRGTACDRCHRACPVREDSVLIAPDGRVFIDPRSCIGCGMCRAACPTQPVSIEVEPPSRF